MIPLPNSDCIMRKRNLSQANLTSGRAAGWLANAIPMKTTWTLTAVFLLLLGVSLARAVEAPAHLVLTYVDDPSTTITVNWQTFGVESGDPIVYYDAVSRDGAVDAYSSQAKGEVLQIEGLSNRFIYRVTLRDLEPDTIYYLVAGSATTGISREIKMRTIPSDDRSLRFVTGGDMGPSYLTRLMLKQAARFDPDFALVGGDIAYANGKLEHVGRWDSWLRYYTEEMVTASGLTIPLVLAIGNHEVAGGFGKTKSDAPFFFNFFGQDRENTFFTRRFGKNLVFFILDTGHVTPHADQVGWLREQLQANQAIKYKAALYHVPLYPSHRDFMGKYSDAGRKHWAPLFDEYGLTVAFENHDHTYKRTPPIKDNSVAPADEGTLYLGDGCWGMDGRRVRLERPWYLEESGSFEHFWVADLGPDKAVYRAVDAKGQVFDVYPATEPGAAAAREVRAAKHSLYFLPNEAAQVQSENVEGETWSGSEATFTLKNLFKFPVRFSLELGGDAGLFRTSESFGRTIDLEPGAEIEHRVSFAPADGAAVPIADINLQVIIYAEGMDGSARRRFQQFKRINVSRE